MGFSKIKEIKVLLKQYFKDIISIEEESSQRLIIDLESKDIVAMVNQMKDFMGFEHLSMISCVDWPEEEKFEVVYVLTSYGKDNIVAMLKTKVDRKEPKLQSIMNLWPQAVTYEIELNEMFGVFFEGNERMGEEFILEDWDDIPPMRRDFDSLEYANNNFKFRDERKDKIIVREFISEHYDEWRKK